MKEIKTKKEAHMKTDMFWWPKIDLHHHLEGSIRTKTYIELMKERGLDKKIRIPMDDEKWLERLLIVGPHDEGDFHWCLSKFHWLRFAVADKEAISRLVFEAIEDSAADNVKYLELRISPGPLLEKGISEADIISGIEEGWALGEKKTGIRVGIIAGITREQPIEYAERVVDLAIKGMDKGIRGIDLLSDESYPPELFKDVYLRAERAGLFRTVHAGEYGGTKNVITAVEELHANRLGHGTNIYRDDPIAGMRAVLDHDVHIECNLSTNVAVGNIRNVSEHPIKRMMSDGISVNINTDDPVQSNVVLSREYTYARDEIGITEEQLKAMTLRTLDHIFRPELKEELRKVFVFD